VKQVSCLAYSSTLNLEATYFTKTSAGFQQTTWCYIPEDRTLHDNHCENLKSFLFNGTVLTSEVIWHQTGWEDESLSVSV
jgi:hypothetical protein